MRSSSSRKHNAREQVWAGADSDSDKFAVLTSFR